MVNKGVVTIKEILIEVVMGVLVIIILTTMVFSSFDNQRANIEVMASNESHLDKVKKDSILSINQEGINKVKGSDVVATIKYYQEQTDIEVIVNVGGSKKTYIDTLYKASDFSISEIEFHESMFLFSKSEDGTTITFNKE